MKKFKINFSLSKKWKNKIKNYHSLGNNVYIYNINVQHYCTQPQPLMYSESLTTVLMWTLVL